MHPGKVLKKYLKKGPVIVPGVYDCLSAHLVQKLGFKGAYLTGGGLSVSFLGKPDIGLLTLDEVVLATQRMLSAVSLPLIVDGDTGFGNHLHVGRLVRECEAAGAAGIQIEDQAFPKRCGHLTGKSLIPATEMVSKIRYAVKSRKNSDFLIIARTDARGVTGLKDAIKRAVLYKKAGADIIFPEALKSQDEFRQFGRKKKLGPLLANMTEFGRSPALSASELASLGFRLILFPMTAFRASAFAIERILLELKEMGTTKNILMALQTRKELYRLIGYERFEKQDHLWQKKAARR